MEDPFQLNRFVSAQKPEYEGIRRELQQGRKQGHWMWFVFPQVKGLGRSETANFYAVSSRAEAEAYLRHPVLGKRLVECTELVQAVEGRSAEEIFGGIDAMNFRSSMTLFAIVSEGMDIFAQALKKYFGGQQDQRTQELLAELG